MIFLTTPLVDQIRLMREYGVDRRYYPRAAARLGLAAVVEPISRFERKRFERLKPDVEAIKDPVFVLGFGRSGTTLLHNLLCQDERFGHVSNYQALAHSISLIGKKWLPGLLKQVTPATRPMDNVAVAMDMPQEEEIAIANNGRDAPLHFMSFPRYSSEIYDPYVFFDSLDEDKISAWRTGFLDAIQKASILCGGKTLVLKTPTNTARIPLLLDLFPDARFIYIHRCPYAVYRSMLNMYDKILPSETLQEINWTQVEKSVVRNYQLTIGRYLEHRGQIPEQNLLELRFEDLESDPLAAIRKTYAQLELPDFSEAEPGLVKYLETLTGYQKNSFEYSPELIERVNAECGTGFEPFGYEFLNPDQVCR